MNKLQNDLFVLFTASKYMPLKYRALVDNIRNDCPNYAIIPLNTLSGNIHYINITDDYPSSTKIFYCYFDYPLKISFVKNYTIPALKSKYINMLEEDRKEDYEK